MVRRNWLILRDGAVAPPQDEVGDPHGGEERSNAARLEPSGREFSRISSIARPLPPVGSAVREGRHWFQIQSFKDDSLTRLLIDQAVEAGVEALVFTADSPYPGRRDRALRRRAQLPAGVALPGWAILHDPETMDGARKSVIPPVAEGTTWIADLEAIRAISPLPVLVKGIMTAEDAVRACEHGAAGVIVSNHGGRHNDDAPATLDVLPRIVEAIGDRTEVLVDGGIRRGSDVVKALALGARAVLAGRAVIWGLASDGEAGSLRVLEILRSEIRSALAEVGCAATDALTRAHVASSTPGCAEMNLPRS